MPQVSAKVPNERGCHFPRWGSLEEDQVLVGAGRVKCALWDMLSLRCLGDTASSHVKQGIVYTVLVLRGESIFKTTKATGVDEIT